MSKEEKFKKTLQQILDESNFSFQESDWEGAKKVIDDHRRKRRFRALWFVLSGIALFSSLIVLLPSAPEKTIAENKPESHTNTIETKNTPEITPENKPATVVKTPSEKPQPKKIVANTKPVEVQAVPEQHKTVVPEKLTSNTPANQDPLTVSSEEKPNSNTSSQAPTGEILVSIPTKTNEVPEEENNSTLNKSLVSTPAQTETVLTLAPALIANPINPVPPAPEEKVTKSDSVATEKKVTDSTTTVAAAAPAPPLPESKKKMVWSAEAGFNLLYGWNSTAGTEGRGFNPILGLNYHNSFSEQFDYSIGFNFTTVGHLHAFSDTSKVTYYKFGEESQVTVISPRTFYYVNFPFRVSWNFTQQQSIGANFELGYLLNVNSAVSTYQESFTTSETQNSKEFGYMQGASQYNFQFGFFYRRELFKNLFIQPELFLGLMDLKDNDFFKYQGKEKSSGLKLTLLYSLKNK